MTNTQTPSDNKQATPNKGIQKVNLNDLKGSLSSRGRDKYSNPELEEALRDAVNDGESFIWLDAKVEGKTEKQQTASKAKWRSRCVSVFDGLEAVGHKVRIQWTEDTNQLVVTVYPQND